MASLYENAQAAIANALKQADAYTTGVADARKSMAAEGEQQLAALKTKTEAEARVQEIASRAMMGAQQKGLELANVMGADELMNLMANNVRTQVQAYNESVAMQNLIAGATPLSQPDVWLAGKVVGGTVAREGAKAKGLADSGMQLMQEISQTLNMNMATQKQLAQTITEESIAKQGEAAAAQLSLESSKLRQQNLKYDIDLMHSSLQGNAQAVQLRMQAYQLQNQQEDQAMQRAEHAMRIAAMQADKIKNAAEAESVGLAQKFVVEAYLQGSEQLGWKSMDLMKDLNPNDPKAYKIAHDRLIMAMKFASPEDKARLDNILREGSINLQSPVGTKRFGANPAAALTNLNPQNVPNTASDMYLRLQQMSNKLSPEEQAAYVKLANMGKLDEATAIKAVALQRELDKDRYNAMNSDLHNTGTLFARPSAAEIITNNTAIKNGPMGQLLSARLAADPKWKPTKSEVIDLVYAGIKDGKINPQVGAGMVAQYQVAVDNYRDATKELVRFGVLPTDTGKVSISMHGDTSAEEVGALGLPGMKSNWITSDTVTVESSSATQVAALFKLRMQADAKRATRTPVPVNPFMGR